MTRPKAGARKPPQVKLENRARVLSAALGAGIVGMSGPAIARALRMSDTTAGAHLRDLLRAGLVERSGDTGTSVRWGPPGIVAARKAAFESKAAGRAAYARRAERRRASASDNTRIDATVAQRVPVSVWELA